MAAAAEMTKEQEGQQEGLETHCVSSPRFFKIFIFRTAASLHHTPPIPIPSASSAPAPAPAVAAVGGA